MSLTGAVLGGCDATPLADITIYSTLSMPLIYTYYSQLLPYAQKGFT